MEENIKSFSRQPIPCVESYTPGIEDMGDQLTVGEVAKILNLHRSTVRRWSDLGILRTYRLGPRGDRRFLSADIMSFLENLEHSRVRRP